MKKILIITLVCISMNTLANSGKPMIIVKGLPSDTTVLPQILSLSLNTYIGKPVDSLLSVLPINYTCRGFVPIRISYNRGVFQSYGDSGDNTVSVIIYIDHYQFMTFPNRNNVRTWDMNLAKKEIISFIKVVKNNTTCMYGCNNPNYDY
jgi:hypothetical protein